MPQNWLSMAVIAMLVAGALALVYLLFPPFFLFLAALAAMGALVFCIRQIAFALDRRGGGGRLE